MSNRSDYARAEPRVTLQQVARVTGLSRTTVCDILHRGSAARSYSQETRRRVHQAVRRMGYVPSLAARQLRQGRSGRIGLMLTTEFSGRFFARVAASVEREVRLRKLRLQIAVTDGDVQTELEQMVRLQEDQVEGLIVGPVYDSAELERHRTFFQGRLPTVLFGGPCDCEFDEVALDHAAARRLAAQHLLEMGHERIGFLCAPRSLATRRAAADTLAAELRKAGIGWMGGEEGRGWVVEYPAAAQGGDLGPEDFYAGAEGFARGWKSAAAGSRPTAMICLNDEVAMTAISALSREGIGVPADLSLVGCDNIPEGQYLLPPLTTVDNHAEQQMHVAVELLVKRIAHPRGKRATQLIGPTLIVRQSVRRLSDDRPRT